MMLSDGLRSRLRERAGKGVSRGKANREPVTSVAKVESDRARKNSRVKGSRAELDVAAMFSRWCGEEVRRTPLSGGWSSAKFGVTADLVCANPAFPYSVEIKHREGWVLDDLVTGVRREHDKSVVQWMRQAVKSCPNDKEPLLVFRRNRQPWLVMVKVAMRSYPPDVSFMITTMPDIGVVLVIKLESFLEHEQVPKGLQKYSKPSLSHGMTGSPTYKVWERMIQRCTNPNSQMWENYGGRGIKVCARWLMFTNFFADLGERPSGLSIDRINNDRGYEPGNVRWATKQEQDNNKRTNRRLKVEDGRDHTITEWANITGIDRGTITGRLKDGWSIDEALGLKFREKKTRKRWKLKNHKMKL